MGRTRVPPHIGWSRRYQAALRRYLAQRPGASLQPARGLGLRAVALGLTTLDLARFHGQALLALVSPRVPSGARRRMIARARRFFAGTVVPIEDTHRAALKAGIRVQQLTKTLRRRTVESSGMIRRLKRSVIRRRAAEDALKKSGKHHARLLAEAHRRQKRLRQLTREDLSAQEKERQKMSRRLYDEIAQTLLGINVRLLTLKKAAEAGAETLKKEIAHTQHPVREFARKVNGVSHEFTIKHKG